jgi:Gram-negative bacterial TonB protein C-terminal
LARDSALDSGANVSSLGPSRDTVAPPRDSALAAASLLPASVAPTNSAGLSAGAITGESGDFTPPHTLQTEQVRESSPSLPSFAPYQMDDSILKLRRQIASQWIEPAPTRRNGAVIAVVGILVAALVFTAGLTVGNGYLEKWLGHGDAVKQVANASSDNPSHSSTNSPVNTANSPDNSPGTSPAHAQTSTGETQAAPNAEENPLPGNAGAFHGPRASKPRSATASAPVDESLRPLLVTPPSEGSSPFRLTLPEKAVSASHSLAISSQRSVLVPPEPGAASFHHAERLQIGGLIFHVEPHYPRGRDQIEIEEIIKLRATVGENGQIADVKQISGPMPLIPAAMSAIREWRYAPTLLNGRPVKTETDVTIVFRAR